MICRKAVMLHSRESASDLLLSDHGSYIVWKHGRKNTVVTRNKCYER